MANQPDQMTQPTLLSMRMALFLGALTGVLILGVVVGVASLLGSRTVQAQATEVTGMRQITVIGEGEAGAAPDTAHVEIGVETQAPTSSAAISQNSAQVSAVIARLQELGIAEADIRTSNLGLYAIYGEQPAEITGYNANNTVHVVIRDLAQASTLLDEVVQVGANRIYGLHFRVADPAALQAEARGKALENARTRAEQMAQASGASLGEVLVITENIGEQNPVPFGRGGGAAVTEMAADVPVQEGEQQVHARIQVTFALR